MKRNKKLCYGATVSVSKGDIHYGRAGEPTCCPIALAIKRKTKGAVSVGYETVRIGAVSYGLPESAKMFIQGFDNNGKDYVSPFRFQLRGTVAR